MGAIITLVLKIPLKPQSSPTNIPMINNKFIYSDGAFLNKIFLMFSLNSLRTRTTEVVKYNATKK